MENKLPISVTMLVKNSERYLAKSLLTLSDFQEVIILDNGSTDKSLEIAAEFTNVVIKTSEFIGFGPLKNLAASYAKNDWIFNLDSDEILTKELITELYSLDLSNETNAYRILRLNHYSGKIVKVCNQYPDYVNRIYNKKHVRFNDKQVHESLEQKPNIQLITLKNSFLHYSFDGAADLINKMQHYTTLFAEENKYKRSSSISQALLHGFSAFFKNYFLKKGITAGATGLSLSVANALGAYYKYLKLYEANQSLSVALIITTYNRPDALSAVLNSVLAQTELPDQVIVADDGSSEETLAVIKQYQEIYPIQLIHSWQEDKGFRLARSRNLAIKKATADYLVMVDGDMILHPKFIADQKKYAKLGQFVQGGRIILSNKKTQDLLQKPTEYPYLHWYNKGLDKRLEKRIQACHLLFLTKLFINPKLGEHKGIRGCNMAFFKQDVADINGFNNEFEGWGREDSEFVERLYNNGVKRINLRFAAIAYHLWHHEEDRDALPKNDQLLAEAINQNLNTCANGLQQTPDEDLDKSISDIAI